MNRIYRLVWNKKRNMLVAVSEAARAHGKDAGGETTIERGAGAPIAGAGLIAAAIFSFYPHVAVAQFDPNIPNGQTLSLTDGDLQDAAVSTIVDDGTFDISATTAGASIQSLSGSGAVLLGGQTLTLTNANDTFAGTISGSGGVAITGGTAILGGINDYTGTTSIDSGTTLKLSGSGGIANSSVLDNGTFNISATTTGASIQSLSGSGAVLLGGQTLTLTNANDIFAGTISGSGGLAITGGSETLTGNNTYTGATSIGAGTTLKLSGSGGIASSLDVGNNGVLNISATISGAQIKNLSGSGTVLLGGQTLTLTTANGTFTGGISGSGGVVISGGTATLSGTNGFTGTTTIGTGSTLKLSGNGSIASSGKVTDDGVLNISATNSGASIKSLSGSGSVILGGQTLTITSANDSFTGTISGSGGVALSGGVMSLSGINTHTGGTTINAGTLTIAADSNLGGAGGKLTLNGGKLQTTASLSTSREVEITGQNGSIETDTNTTLTLNGNLSGSGRLTKEGGGTLVLAGDNAGGLGSLNTNGSGWTGGLTINGGLVNVTNPYGLGWGSLSLNGGTINASVSILTGQNINLTNSVSVNVGGSSSTSNPVTTVTDKVTVSGSGTLVKDGGGVLVLEGTVSNTGGIQVNEGVLTLSGNNTYTGDTSINGGTLKIASDGNLGAASSNITLNGGTLQTTASLASNRSLVITSQNGAIETTGTNTMLTLNGNLSGGGRLTKDGDGILVLGGNNIDAQGAQNSAGWTGGLVINAGQVEVTNAKGLGAGELVLNAGTLRTSVDIVAPQNISVGTNAVISTESSTTMTLSGNVVSAGGAGGSGGGGGGGGSSCFTKTGLGTLNLAGSATFDATCVLAGRLLANGSFSSLVTVEQDGTLGGSGSINGQVAVKGTLSPGNSPGMLTANSTITMAPGSTYKEDIGGAQQASASTPVGAPGFYSFLHVTGNNQFVIQDNATLAPALKDLYTVGEAGYGTAPFVPSVGQTYRFITADGGIVGRFARLTQPDGMAGGTRMAVFYNIGGSNSIDLAVLPSSYSTWVANINGNGRAAGAVLDRIVDLNQSGSGNAVQDQLLLTAASRDAASLGSFVKGLSGEVHAALDAAAAQSGWAVQGAINKHLLEIQGNAGRKDARGLWIDVGGNRGKWSGDGNASGFSANRQQLTLGADVHDEGVSRLGFGITHAKSDVSADLGSGSVSQNSGFVYGQAGWKGFIVDGLASHGRNKIDSTRNDPAAMMPALSSSTDGNSSMLGVGLRAPWQINGATYEPFVRLAVHRLTRDAGNETSGSIASLGLNAFSATGTRVVAGLSGASIKSDPLASPATYRFSVGLGADGGKLSRVSQSANLAGLSTTVGAPDVGRVFVQGSVTGTAQLGRQSYVYIGLAGEVRSGYRDFGGNIGVRAAF
ncbi:MAG TPA: ESPR-type extended signal peptide-containing protein [Noviherbaspirillum sp.]|nr:ESPR-type extended signal peptide-containing protein [Noviherbaspirillum sp.]